MTNTTVKQTVKSLYPLGEHPPLGEVPDKMLAYCLRQNNLGEPQQALRIEEVATPSDLAPNEVLVYVMAAGVNYNVVWASRGKPVDPIARLIKLGGREEYMIPGSDASGIVYKVGSQVSDVKVGDEVILHCGRYDPEDPTIKAGGSPEFAPSRHIWGYESNFGALAQFCKVQSQQCITKPKNIGWAEAASYFVSGATAYRMLHGWSGNQVKKDSLVLVWGGAGGLGSYAIQIAKAQGAKPIAVVSNDKSAEYCLKLGAIGTINRTEYTHWGELPHTTDQEAYNNWLTSAKKFGAKIWEIAGQRRNPDIVVEHPGEATIPTSIFVVNHGGMVVICAGTSGYNATLDLRYHWMHQKRLQGSHFASRDECIALTELIAKGEIDPKLGEIFQFEDAPTCHQLLADGNHPPGNMAILVNASVTMPNLV